MTMMQIMMVFVMQMKFLVVQMMELYLPVKLNVIIMVCVWVGPVSLGMIQIIV